MSKDRQQLLAVGAAAAVIVAVVAYVVWPTFSEAPTNPPSAATDDVKMDDVKVSVAPVSVPVTSASGPPAQGGGGALAAPRAGSYEAYAPEKVAFAKTGSVILFFNAPSCGGCEVVDADIRARLKDIPRGVTILEVDFDADEGAREKYGVLTPHLFIQVDAWGSKITQWSGSLNLRDILMRMVRR